MAAKRTTNKRAKKLPRPSAKAKRTTAKAARATSTASRKSTRTPAGNKRTAKKKSSRSTSTTRPASTASASTVSAKKVATGKGRAARTTASSNHKNKKKTVASRMSRSRSTSPATAQDPIQFPEEKPLPKTKLTAKQLRAFKKRLVDKRAELMGDVRRLADGALKSNADGHGDHATMPIHMADIGSDNWEQELTLGLVAGEQAIVREIDEALDRIANRTYGVCLATRQPISNARLLAMPWAKYCIEYARAREEGRAV